MGDVLYLIFKVYIPIRWEKLIIYFMAYAKGNGKLDFFE